MSKKIISKITCFFAAVFFGLSGCGGEVVEEENNQTNTNASVNELIVKTNSSNFESNIDEDIKTTKGLDSDAYLLQGNSDKWASWNPGTAGIYEIYVHVPAGTTLSNNVYYKISPDGANWINANPGDQILNGWVKLQTTDYKSVFIFTETGFITVFAGVDEEGYPENSTPANIDESSYLPIDATKFILISNPSNDQIANINLQEEVEVEVGEETLSKSTTATITSIEGYNAGSSVKNGKWQGQPDSAPKTASNNYRDWYSIEAQGIIKGKNFGKTDGYWIIKGSNFGKKKGAVIFSNPNVSSKILSWKDSQIKIIPKTSYDFTLDSELKLTVYINDGTTLVEGDSKTIKVVGLIRTRGYGQCTWYAAYKRLANGLSIPETAYKTFVIKSDYVPAKWDYLSYGNKQGINKHVAIITSDVKKTETTDKRSGIVTTTYSFNVGEMNAKYDELIWDDSSAYRATFEVTTDNKGKKSIVQKIGSNAGRNFLASGYYR